MIAPDGRGRWPAVIVFMDAGGVRPAMIGMAEHLAGMGYVAFLPEMYYRHGPYEPFRIDTVFTDPDERTRLMALAGSLTKAMAASDAGAFLKFLSERQEVAGTKVGSTGYCWGAGCRSRPRRTILTVSGPRHRSTAGTSPAMRVIAPTESLGGSGDGFMWLRPRMTKRSRRRRQRSSRMR
jgi:hypothetical protein